MATKIKATLSGSILDQLNDVQSYSKETKSAEDETYASLSPSAFQGSETKTMYAIAFDLDTATLQKAYHVAAYNNAYADIRNRLISNHGFTWQQGSVYFGGDTVNAVTCVMAVIDLTNTFSWFAASVRDIRMLRIEEQNDLSPAIRQALASQNQPPSTP